MSMITLNSPPCLMSAVKAWLTSTWSNPVMENSSVTTLPETCINSPVSWMRSPMSGIPQQALTNGTNTMSVKRIYFLISTSLHSLVL